MAFDRDRLPLEQIAAFCQRHRIRRLALFGSVLRDDFRPDSDLDVLVEFEPATRVGLRFFTIQDELSNLFGRNVDLSPPIFSASASATRCWRKRESSMSRRDDRVSLRHMLDHAR